MILNQREQFQSLTLNKKVYHVSGGDIQGYYYAGINPHTNQHIMMVWDADVTQIKCFWFKRITGEESYSKEVFTTDYDEAKNAKWNQMLEKLKSVDEIYFSGEKNAEELIKTLQS